MTLEEFLASEERILAYREWLANPMTQQVFQLAAYERKKLCLNPRLPLDGADSLTRAALLGVLNRGREELLDFMMNVDTVARTVQKPEVLPTYGAENILMGQGYITPEGEINA